MAVGRTLSGSSPRICKLFGSAFESPPRNFPSRTILLHRAYRVKASTQPNRLCVLCGSSCSNSVHYTRADSALELRHRNWRLTPSLQLNHLSFLPQDVNQSEDDHPKRVLNLLASNQSRVTRLSLQSLTRIDFNSGAGGIRLSLLVYLGGKKTI
ncbi:hypothetical protein CC78DRAFT_573852 [Lojkania enalia]|uniref:Uncharacterized protein n=1 Tax=Lojkania enalia TaxID=147567 RepID=A0A9P4NC76_9PLEO|nr:hypothetical protein CC78DRAFT_573852 [Didymosphaeria enalia]